MLIDTVAMILLLMALFKGLRKGLIIAVFSFLGFLAGLAAALKLSALVADQLSRSVHVSQKWLPVIAFVLVFIAVALLVRLGARMLEGIIDVAQLGWLNKIGGVVFYLLIYLFIFSILLFYATQIHLFTVETTRTSVTYSYIQPLGPKMISAIGLVIPFFRNMFDHLLLFFQKASAQKPSA